MARIDHVNIVVTDMQRAIRFYGEALGLTRGFEVTLEGSWIDAVTGLPGARAHCVFMETPGGAVGPPPARLELLQYLSPQGAAIAANGLPHTPGIRHVAFTVDDIDGLVRRLRAMGVEPVSEPVVVPFAVGTMGRKKLCYFHDADGTLLEAASYEGTPHEAALHHTTWHQATSGERTEQQPGIERTRQ